MEYFERHEIFRHEAFRLFSLSNMFGETIEHKELSRIASMGFYFDLETFAFICFSCNDIINYYYFKQITVRKLHKISFSAFSILQISSRIRY